jgi:hypothetical protein
MDLGIRLESSSLMSRPGVGGNVEMITSRARAFPPHRRFAARKPAFQLGSLALADAVQSILIAA